MRCVCRAADLRGGRENCVTRRIAACVLIRHRSGWRWRSVRSRICLVSFLSLLCFVTSGTSDSPGTIHFPSANERLVAPIQAPNDSRHGTFSHTTRCSRPLPTASGALEALSLQEEDQHARKRGNSQPAAYFYAVTMNIFSKGACLRQVIYLECALSA